MDKLQEENQLYRLLLDAIPDPVIVKNWEGNFVFSNQSCATLYNTTPDEMIGKDDYFFTGNKEQSDFFHKNIQEIILNGNTEVVYEDSTDAATGETRNFQSLKIPLENAKGEKQILVIARDITEVMRSKDEAEESYKQLGYVLDATQDGVWDWRIPTGKVSHNKRWYQLTGIEPLTAKNSVTEFLGLIHPKDVDHVKHAIDETLTLSQEYHLQYRIIKPNEEVIWVLDRGKVVERDETGKPTRMVGAMSDISLQIKAKNKIEELAYYDPLTHLPNRRLLNDRINMAKRKNHDQDCRSALLFVDLDHFKILNDTLGHQMGDLLLQEVAKRLSNYISEIDTVARFGGDEFVVLINELSKDPITSANQAHTISERLRKAMGASYCLKTEDGEINHIISASVGIITFGFNESNDELLKLSDLALYRAKMDGRDISVVFDPTIQQEIDENSHLIKSLRKAIANEEFELYYQPQYDVEKNLIGMEALIRWQQPEDGFIPPDQFIPMAEDTLLILPIGQWVLESTCRQIHAWQSHPTFCTIPISVNMSAKQIWQKNFIDTVITTIEKYDFPKNLIRMEITESVLLNDNEETIDKLHQLKALGIEISLDDFGTGFSSLSYLKNMPIDEIKIDQSFIRDLEHDPSDSIMVKTIIDLGKNFNIKVIAEGVENNRQLSILKEFGCTNLQGFLFNKALPASKIEEMM